MIRRVSTLVVVVFALFLTGCTVWGSVTFPPLEIAGHYSGPDWIPGATEAAHEPTATPYAEPSPTGEPWQPEPCLGIVTANPRLNVRSGPGGVVTGSLRLGAQVEIIGSEAGWWQIIQPPGWVSGIFVRLETGC